jgi:Glu-tRNA(Gln) amidotransferase subunit E-like FAD-binding protein
MVEELKKIDYDAVGFKAGLEIHQQLNTGKLFCHCPSVLRQDKPDYTVRRKLHAVAGEEGEVDIAARHEAEKNKEFFYGGYDTTCLVELDEMPPYEINLEALKIALQVAVLFNAKIFPISQIMRKTVINGSNTSGFQRSVLIARDGWIITKTGRVGIQSICLEEDAARITEINKDSVVYRLDRLGIPLIEISTAPDIKNAEHVKEVALYLGNVLRSCNVKRGIGTIRQDINLSVKDGNRVEIKGFQDTSMMTKTVENEVERQTNLLGSGKYIESEVRNALPSGETEFLRPMPGSARMYPETDLPLLKISREMTNDVKKTLPKLREDIEKELRKEGLNSEMIKLIFKENKIDEYKELVNILKNPELVAKMLTLWRNELASKLNKSLEEVENVINTDVLEEILKGIKKGRVHENNVRNIFTKLMQGLSLDEILDEKEAVSDNVEEKIVNLIKSKPGLSANAYMGLVMKEFHGKIDGKTAMEIIGKWVK